MKIKILLVIFVFLCSAFLLPKDDPWGNLKKIHFYDSVKNDQQVLTQLELIEFEGLTRADQKEIASQLVRFGDYYFEKGKYDQAKAFYKKVFDVSPNDDYWYLYNKLEKIKRVKGSFFIGFKSIFGQLFLALKNFKASFLLVNQLFNLLFFSTLFTFLIFSLILFIKYFKLAGNDLLLGEKKKFSFKKILFILLAILWPALIISGWIIYPFLVTGFLWFYLNENEKKAVKYMLIAVAFISALYSLNLMLEKNLQTDSFKQAQQVYEGQLFDKEVYDTFDDGLKVAQALSYYESYYEKKKSETDPLDTALDILNSTSDSYKSLQKYTLIGNIYYRHREISQSIKYFSDALLLDDNNEIALNNFTLALLKEGKPDVFRSYADRYPQIESLRTKAVDIKNAKLDSADLWKRLFNFSKGKFNPGLLFKGIIGQLLKLPVVYYLLLFIIYVSGLKKLEPFIGQSTYCSKCRKIIKEASIHKSYKLCDDCYQLFSIKDVIFLEAKILKEKELKKNYRKKLILYLIFSLFIPGLNFNYRGSNRLFLLLAVIFYFLVGLAVVGMVNFNHIFSAAPLFFNLVGIGAVGFYFLVNIFSVLGEENGF
jgi:tetratricopeptide (TPR) repeat protein